LTIAQASELLLAIAVERKEQIISQDTPAIGCARLGSNKQRIVFATLGKLQDIDFGDAPYCLIVPAKLHFAEEEFLEQYLS